jgi:hypothetical protein
MKFGDYVKTRSGVRPRCQGLFLRSHEYGSGRQIAVVQMLGGRAELVNIADLEKCREDGDPPSLLFWTVLIVWIAFYISPYLAVSWAIWWWLS